MSETTEQTELAECEFWEETWGPHPGCREFMSEPEVWKCAEVATSEVRWWDSYIEGYEATQDREYGGSSMRVCRAHLQVTEDIVSHDPSVRDITVADITD